MIRINLLSERVSKAVVRRLWREKNKEKCQEYERAWAAKQSPEYKARRVARARELRKTRTAETKARYHAAQKDWRLRKDYGISLADWHVMFDAQNRRCACCLSEKPKGRYWHVDHEHASGRIRGIVCAACNRTLGFLGDTADEVAESAARLVSYARGDKCRL